MNSLDDRLWDAQGHVPSLSARVSFPDYKNAWLVFEKIANLVGAQIPNFGNFRNSIVPFNGDRLLDLGR
jgi:hypothetical protein